MTSKKVTPPPEPITLHLVLTQHWYDETTKAQNPKRIEYRKPTARWMKLIYERRAFIRHVRFARAYTATMATFAVEKIDIGPCLIPGHEGERIRIHFLDTETPLPFVPLGIHVGKRVGVGDASGVVIGFRNAYTAVCRFGLADRDLPMEGFL